MKISDLIIEIQNDAQKFDTFDETNHINDCINVVIYHCPDNFEWQVNLSRPTQHQLDRGEIEIEIYHTVKVAEGEHRFFTVGSTLNKALREMQKKILAASEWDDG